MVTFGEFRQYLFDVFSTISVEDPAGVLRERSLVGRIARHLAPMVEVGPGDPVVDIDYRAAGDNPKTGFWLSQNGNRNLPVEVDLIVHERAGDNFFCGEFKPAAAGARDIGDAAKLAYLLGRVQRRGQVALGGPQPGPYRLGASIRREVHVARHANPETWELDWFLPAGPTWMVPDFHVPNVQRRNHLVLGLPNRRVAPYQFTEQWHLLNARIPAAPVGFPAATELYP